MKGRKQHGFLIYLPALVTAFAACYLLLYDLRTQDLTRGGHSIGKLIRFEGKVRHKPFGYFIWKDVQPQQTVFKGDRVMTGSDASAIIQLETGQTIQIQQNSSVVLEDLENLVNPEISGSLLVRELNGEERYLSGHRSDARALAEVKPCKLLFPEEFAELFIAAAEGAFVNFSWKSSAAGKLTVASSTASVDSANYNFEGGLQGWTATGGMLSAAWSASTAWAGTHSLSAVFGGSGSDTQSVVVGSAFVRLIERYAGDPGLEARLEALARELKGDSENGHDA